MSGGPQKLRARSAGLTDVGRQRKHNEDHFVIQEDLGFWVVADGMGGHNAGDIASRLTTTSLKNFFEATAVEQIPKDLLVEEDVPHGPEAARRLVAGIKKANRDVYVISSTHQQHHGMGSTVVAMHLDATGTLHIAHVGDSRAYRLRDGRIEQLTRDHSLINDAIDMKPDLTEDEIARLPKNIITRALGMRDEVKVDYRALPVQDGDAYLLCSDGLSGMVTDEQILEIVSLASEPEEACELLVSEANDAGGLDNVSAVLVQIDEVPDLDAVASGPKPRPLAGPADHAVASKPEPRTLGGLADPPEVEPPAADPPVFEPFYAAAGSGGLKLRSVPALDSDEAAGPKPRSVARSADPPEVEVEPVDTGLEHAVTPSVRALLDGGAEVDLELTGPWSDGIPETRRCPSCGHSVYAGNVFCVECGTAVEQQ